MSQATFPVLPGLAWNVTRTPQWNTRVQKTVGGSELRASYYSQPIRRYQLTYDVLRATTALQELQSLAGFFHARQGSYDSFLYDDPTDDAVTAHGFGVGDGTTTAFQLQRTAAGPRTLDWQGALAVPTTPRTNLLIHTDNLNGGGWTLDGVTIATGAGAIAPDGVSGSDVVIGTNATADHRVYQASVQHGAGQVSYAVCLRNRSWRYAKVVLFNATDGEYAVAVVDLTAGKILSSTGTAALTAYPLNGWYRIAVTGTAAAGSSNALIFLSDSAGDESITLTGVEALDVFAPQVEVGTPTSYIKSTTSVTTATPAYWPAQGDGFEPIYNLNLPAQTPTLYRRDWQGNQLLYPYARPNSILYSEQFDNAAWTKAGATITANATTAPDGNATADKLCEDASTGAHYALQGVTGIADNATVTASCFVKAAERTWIALHSTLKSGVSIKSFFNLGSGVWGTVGTGHTVTATALPNGWYRLSWSFSVGTGATTPQIALETSTGNTVFSYAGAAGSGLYIWGASLDPSATIPTSYLPTTSAAASVTDYTLSANGLVTFASAPLSGAALTWTGGYYWRCRFEKDLQEFNNFLYQLWEAKSVAFVTVKGS